MEQLFQFRPTACADPHLTDRQHQSLAHLRAVFDVVSLVEAKVAQVVGWRPFAGFPCLWGQGEV